MRLFSRGKRLSHALSDIRHEEGDFHYEPSAIPDDQDIFTTNRATFLMRKATFTASRATLLMTTATSTTI
jgi:hypothetical protein